MERRGANTWLVAVLALAVRVLAALVILRRNDDSTAAATIGATTATTSTTSTAQAAAPQDPQATVGSCINLWNQANNNRGTLPAAQKISNALEQRDGTLAAR